MELELEELAAKLVPSEEYRKDCQRAVLFLKSAFSQEFLQKGIPFMQGAPKMEMAGSAVQNTEVEGSDLDVVCSCLAGTLEEQEGKMGRFWEKLCSPPHSNNLEATDAMRLFPHAPCQFSVKLKGPGVPKLHAHVILDETAQLETATGLDMVIRQLCDCCTASRDLVRLVKFWAINHGLSSQQEGYMNGVAWAAFVLSFLQRQQHVPLVAELGDGRKESPSADKPKLTELLRGFFQFVCAPQPITPRGISLEGIDCEAAPPPTSHVGPPPPLYIEDPVSAKQGIRKNLAATLGESQWARILEESRRIADRLDPAKPQRWFYWAEVFDPQGLAGGGKRLPKLSETVAGQEGGSETPALTGPAQCKENTTQNTRDHESQDGSQAKLNLQPNAPYEVEASAASVQNSYMNPVAAGKGYASFPGNFLGAAHAAHGPGNVQTGSLVHVKGWPPSKGAWQATSGTLLLLI